MNIRILIADGYTIVRHALKAICEKEPDLEVVEEAEDGPGTIEAVTKYQIDVLLLDSKIPRSSTSELVKRLLQAQPHLAIVVLTYEEENGLQTLLEMGVRALIPKRSTSTTFFDGIRAAYRGDRYVAPTLAGNLVAPSTDLPTTNMDLSVPLTPREREVCTLLAYGHTTVESAEKLSISDRTVEAHRRKIMTKLGVTNRAGLVRFAIDTGLLTLD